MSSSLKPSAPASRVVSHPKKPFALPVYSSQHIDGIWNMSDNFSRHFPQDRTLLASAWLVKLAWHALLRLQIDRGLEACKHHINLGILINYIRGSSSRSDVYVPQMHVLSFPVMACYIRILVITFGLRYLPSFHWRMLIFGQNLQQLIVVAIWRLRMLYTLKRQELYQ